MTTAEANDILEMSPESLGSFLMEHRRRKTLSSLVRRLNESMLGDDSEAQSRAEAVLERIGLLHVD
ncbi:MAG: hypothetical protein AAGF88_03565 [Pseudomonadota bacterium]